MKTTKQLGKAKVKGCETTNHQVNSDISSDTLLHMACGTTGFLLFVAILSGIVLSSTAIHAANPAQSNVTVNVNTACTASGGGTYSAKAVPGNTVTIAGSTFSTVCNDSEGYSIYAIGYGDESYDTPTNTQMIGEGSIGNIVTGTAKSGNTSNWAMQVTPTSGSTPTITNGFDSANFHVVPEDYTQVAKYTSSTASPTATGARIDAKYQAYVISTQAIGTYAGKVKYTMVHPNTAPAPSTKIFMQDATLADCGETMYDKRDQKDYATTLINGECYMTQNLRFAETSLTTDTSNVSTNKTLSYGDLTSGNSYTEPRIHNSGNTTTGVWYNFCAAGANESNACNNSGSYSSSYDICPKNWHLPTESQFSGITSYKDAFSPVTGGCYINGSLSDTGRGVWWSSTASDARYQYSLPNSGSTGISDKLYGNYVRCVMNTPTPTMQSVDSSTLASMMPNVGDTTTLRDARDGQAYSVAKLADGQYWMTTNLNLAGGTALSAYDTDVISSYISNFTTSNNLTKSGNTIVLPASSTSGFNTGNYSYVYNSGNTPASDSDCGDPGCYSYYSWDAATLGSGRSITAAETDAPYSICPKGWHLPNTRDGTDDTSDFRKLMIALGGSSSQDYYQSTTTPTGATMFAALHANPNNFLRAGVYVDSTFYDDGNGWYWSATSGDYSGTDARDFSLNSTGVYSAGSYNRENGASVRCIAD